MSRGNFITDRHGNLNPNYKHGLKNTRLFRIWSNMKTRCYNDHSPSFKWYGARGITMCNEWRNDFKLFYEWAMSNGYRDDLTIDRIDNDGNYCPENCRWETTKSQALNTRRNHLVEMNGEIKSLSEWCEILSINYRTVQDRLKRGWSHEEALTEPVQTKFRKKVI